MLNHGRLLTKKKIVCFTAATIALLSFLFIVCSKNSPTASSKTGPAAIETSSLSISATSGGTITLPGGSGVTIPAGFFTADTMATLSLLSSMPQQPAGGVIQGVGTCLKISFGPDSGSQSAHKLSALATASGSGEADFTINYGAGTVTNLTGSVPVIDIIDSSGNHNFAGISGALETLSGSVTAIFQVQAARIAHAQSMVLGMVNMVPGAAVPLTPEIWNGSGWVQYPQGFDKTKKTLLLVHGIFSNVNSAYPCAADIMAAGGYKQVLGFNYDWTQAMDATGSSFANFLNTLKTAGLSQLDIEAHSYGGLTVMTGAVQSTLKINNIILEGSPISGTPAASMAQGDIVPWVSTVLLLCGEGSAFPSADMTFEDICNGGYVTSLQIGVTALIPQLLAAHPETQFIRVAGIDNSLGPLFSNGLIFQGALNDGVVDIKSLSAPSLPGPATMSFPLTHIELECDTNVIKAVGALVKTNDTSGKFDGGWIGTDTGTEVISGQNGDETYIYSQMNSLLIKGLVIQDIEVNGAGSIDGSGNGTWTDSSSGADYSILMIHSGKFLPSGTASGTWTESATQGSEIITGSGTWSYTREATQ